MRFGYKSAATFGVSNRHDANQVGIFEEDEQSIENGQISTILQVVIVQQQEERGDFSERITNKFHLPFFQKKKISRGETCTLSRIKRFGKEDIFALFVN